KQEQLHQVLLDGWTRRLQKIDVAAADRLTQVDLRLAIGEALTPVRRRLDPQQCRHLDAQVDARRSGDDGHKVGHGGSFQMYRVSMQPKLSFSRLRAASVFVAFEIDVTAAIAAVSAPARPVSRRANGIRLRRSARRSAKAGWPGLRVATSACRQPLARRHSGTRDTCWRPCTSRRSRSRRAR